MNLPVLLSYLSALFWEHRLAQVCVMTQAQPQLLVRLPGLCRMLFVEDLCAPGQELRCMAAVCGKNKALRREIRGAAPTSFPCKDICNMVLFHNIYQKKKKEGICGIYRLGLCWLLRVPWGYLQHQILADRWLDALHQMLGVRHQRISYSS